MHEKVLGVWDRLRAVFSSPESSKKPFIFGLNVDILLLIYDHLPLIDQVCLSLSCKRYFDLFGNVTKHKSFAFPRLLHIKIPRRCVNTPEVKRNQLLIRLEDARWAFCGGCLKLHPRREFRRGSLATQPLERRCEHCAGIVDLCPCISLTARDRDRLIKILGSSPAERGLELEHFPLRIGQGELGRRLLEHNCRIDTYVDHQVAVETDLEMTLFITEGNNLAVRTEYVSHYFTHDPIERWAEPIFTCPHRDLFLFIRSQRYYDKCANCASQTNWCTGRSNARQPITVSVLRSLGKCTWPPDFDWYTQCRFMAHRLVLYEHFWYNTLGYERGN